MALATYNDLKAAVANWTKRSDLSAYLDDLVSLAEVRIFREVRTRDMEQTISTSMSSGTLAVPADFLGWRNVYLSISGTRTNGLTVASVDQIHQNKTHNWYRGKPQMIAQEGSSFVFWPEPDADYTVTGTYYKRPGTLSDGVYSLYTNNPDLFLFATLAETAPFLKDDKRVELWEAKYRAVRDDVNAQDDKVRFSGRLQVTV